MMLNKSIDTSRKNSKERAAQLLRGPKINLTQELSLSIFSSAGIINQEDDCEIVEKMPNSLKNFNNISDKTRADSLEDKKNEEKLRKKELNEMIKQVKFLSESPKRFFKRIKLKRISKRKKMNLVSKLRLHLNNSKITSLIQKSFWMKKSQVSSQNLSSSNANGGKLEENLLKMLGRLKKIFC